MSLASLCQRGILAAVPDQAQYLFFSLAQPLSPRQSQRRALAQALCALRDAGADDGGLVVGLSAAALTVLGARVPGLRAFPSFKAQPPARNPWRSNQTALWCWLRGQDAGDLALRALQLKRLLAPALRLQSQQAAFCHARGANGLGRDLTGYEDGSENPGPRKAVGVALMRPGTAGLDGASLVAVQRWQHAMGTFAAMSQQRQDALIGRRRSDNAELSDAPASAHVKRTEQEAFAPPAFVLRRSMPWLAGPRMGLMFVAFAHSLDAFEAQWRRMLGADDGVPDALFSFSRPLSGDYYWCPPLQRGRLDWRALGLPE